VCKD